MFEAKFQTFDDPPEPTASAPRVAALRTELARRGLTGFIVPRADRQQNEYVPASEERLAWLTGFTGSAGAAIVLNLTSSDRLGYDPWLHTVEGAEKLAKACAAAGAALVAVEPDIIDTIWT